ncbi:MAG: acetyl-CoA C-acyltransferase [Propionibacteriaceae bacterium]|jgi:acetyl-CoA C-acetyltransferase|nr:acetyl-CoA C-acyltransferase [Propionibacteriaceae bacterium]
MDDVVIVSAARTPFGKLGGALSRLTAMELGGLALAQVLSRAGLAGHQVDEVVLGQVVTAGQGQVPARQAAALAGLPPTVPALTVNKVCGSALKAVTLAAQAIKAGDADIVLAGGMESMSQIPYLSRTMRFGARSNHVQLDDAMIWDGLWCPENDVHMAVLAGAVAAEHGVTRSQQDAWACRSQQRWAAGEAAGRFDQERFPVELTGKRGQVHSVTRDEGPRPDTTEQGLARLPALFRADGTVTAGNAPGTNDGAAVLALASRSKAQALGLRPLARLAGYAQRSRPAREIATVPGLAAQALMERHRLSLADFDLIEINEAFAAVPLVSGLSVLGLSQTQLEDKVNVNGGAVAVGHPIGASGARILMTLIFELRRRSLRSGLATICSGTAQGDAVWVEVEP